MELSALGDVKPSQPGDTGRHQTGCHLSISSFSEAFRQHLQSNMLEKATQGTSEKPMLKTAVHLLPTITVYHVLSISDVNNGQQWKWDKSKSKGTTAGSSPLMKMFEKGSSSEGWSLHGESDSMHGRTKKITKPHLR